MAPLQVTVTFDPVAGVHAANAGEGGASTAAQTKASAAGMSQRAAAANKLSAASFPRRQRTTILSFT
ncbi:MAG TPA: hypothetical protein VL048_20115, partial [Xanthobacteraceae bacterium]|nr:hypothetical protein [Xanthobacteraceae bacterium]